MFINVSPVLIELLTFGQSGVLGLAFLVIVSTLMGALGAALIVMPTRWEKALIGGVIWTLSIGLFSENVGQILTNIFGRGILKVLFDNKSLNPIAAILIFGLAFAFSFLSFSDKTKTRWLALPQQKQGLGRKVGLVLAVVLMLALPWIVGRFLSQVLFIVGFYIIMGLGLNIVVGFAGLLDLGYVAFFAFGAYTMGLLTTTGELGLSSLNFWTALPIAMLVGLGFGILLGFPVLGMRGDYLAIVTLGFGEIIRIVAISDWLAPFEGGAQGVLHIPNPNFFGVVMKTPETMYYVVVAGAIFVAFVSIRLRDSRLGRQWMAMREDEDVAEAMGINLIQTKLLAFGIGAAFSALAGAISAARVGNIFPHSFNLLISLNALALIIVGGVGSIPGVIVGALILVGLPELLREFAEYRLLMYGILLVIMMLVKPEGFIPDAVRQRAKLEDESNLPSELGS
jgi:branched-chain amino acid transport system permease protein